ncbi:MAG: arsenate reductase family protein [Prevotella sp.]|jgi:arsenate reductase|nr:arsenate reductase family protein [Prevotella sp.]
MSTKLFLQYPECGTCRKAAKWLKQNDVSVESRDITTDNPTKKELAAWIKKSGLPVAAFFNTSGRIYREENLKDTVKSASESELIDILASNGMLVKRPLVIGDDFVLKGFNEEEWFKKLK